MDAQVQAYCTRLKDLVGDEEPVAVLSRTPMRIKTLIAGVNATVLSYKPSPGKWSITEIVAHLADSELVFGYRLRMIVTENDVHVQAFDPDRWASTFDYQSCDAQTSAELFGAFRMGTLQLLRRVPAALLENTGQHPEWGAETGRSIVRLEAGHDKNHLAQIERILGSVDAMPATIPSEQKREILHEVVDKADLRVGTERARADGQT